MRFVALLIAFVVLGISSVRADAIDGDWCNEVDGSHLRIDGSTIELGSGQIVTGTYSRHAFSYVSPEGAPEAGATIDFVQRSESQMRRVRGKNAMPEHEDLYRRCEPTS